MSNSDFEKAIWKTLLIHIKSLTWRCARCSKVKECEEQPPNEEPRYCLSLLRAAVFGESEFSKVPFPVDGEEQTQEGG